jgi:nucleotide-binding universal stress UspA family protein
MVAMKILWPTDFSSRAEVALPHVVSLTEKYKAEVHILYVIEDLGYHEPWYGEFDRSHIDKIHEWEKKTATKRIDEICEKHLEGCPLYIKHIAIGDPAQEVLKLAEKERVDLLVMAASGRKGNFLFGSVAEKVVKNAPVPVFVVPTRTGG